MTTVKRPLRIYADTSVFGGCFDDEFKNESVRFFEEVRQGRSLVVVSNVTLDELELGPDPVRGVLADLPQQQVDRDYVAGVGCTQKRLPGGGCRGASFQQ
jgi:hypothetical protein